MDYALVISEFATVAREYCTWCERPRNGDSRQVHFQATRLLARLYAAALELPDVHLDNEVVPEPPEVSAPERMRIYKSFADLPFQYYREVFDTAIDKADEPVVGDLADDLTDIYLDVNRGLNLRDLGAEPAAVFEWRFSLGIHWGRHATSAMRALHCYKFPDEDASPQSAA